MYIKGVVAQDFTTRHIAETNIDALDIATSELVFYSIRGVFDGGFFINDPEYAAFRESRVKGSISNLHVIDDTDAAGTIPYLGKG